METTNQNQLNLDEQQNKLPTMLNVLTILTFIGCGLAYLSLILNYFNAIDPDTQIAMLESAQDELGDSGMGKLLLGSEDAIRKTYEYRTLLLVSGFVFTTMCLIGAIQMRKLKMSGYWIYVIGQIAPIVISAAIIGFGSLLGNLGLMFTTIIGIIFIILYTTQKKYLIN